MKTLRENDVVGKGGRFKLIQPIGEGAVLQVWSASDANAAKKYALKFLKDPQNISHLQTESALLQKVGRHPNIVNLYYHELEGETPFIAVDLCHATLHELLGPTGLPFNNPIKKQGVATAKTIDLAHAIKFVHDKTSDTIIDLDPMNVMFQHYDDVTEPVQFLEGIVKICDLNAQNNGVSIRDSLLSSLSTSMRIGNKGSTHVFAKPYFIAPELLEPDAKPTFAADVYTLGKILMIMLTGRKELNPRYMPSKMGIAPSYDEVIATAVEPRVQDRFQDIGQFLEALEEAKRRPVKAEVSFWEAVKNGGYEKARAKKERLAEEAWRSRVQGIVTASKRKMENAEKDKLAEAERKEREEKQRQKQEQAKKQREQQEEAERAKLHNLEALLKDRSDDSRVAWLTDVSDITIYQVNQVNDSTYSPTKVHVPRCKRDSFAIKWLAWINNGKHIAYCADFKVTPNKRHGNTKETYSAIGLINTETLEIKEESLEYSLRTDNIHADTKDNIIYAANDKGELIRFDLLNPEKADRARFVPIRGLKVCKQENSGCGQFILKRRHGGNRKYNTVILHKDNSEIPFVLGNQSNMAVWYDPEQKTETSS
ncbi:hypothetical protein KY310_01465 [Candidatus Woesearchaeota archaeon]|nr:hypothetical protein [Candidatus Woesearchaeota archaeon]